MPKPSHVQALLFDMGGVVFEIDFDRAFHDWEQHSRLSLNEMRHRFHIDEAYRQHERGEIGADVYFAHLRNVLEIDASDEDIAVGWNAIYGAEITATLNDILSVRDKLLCFAFTNTNPTHQITWTATYPRVVAAFERVFVSSELGLRKPERAAFDAIVEATGISAPSFLFFDDLIENVEGARMAGLQSIHVQTPSDVKQALVDIGLLT
ncbi:MAG: HAD-IA family hydrolase [Pseudomonadales bacterium]